MDRRDFLGGLCGTVIIPKNRLKIYIDPLVDENPLLGWQKMHPPTGKIFSLRPSILQSRRNLDEPN